MCVCVHRKVAVLGALLFLHIVFPGDSAMPTPVPSVQNAVILALKLLVYCCLSSVLVPLFSGYCSCKPTLVC